MAVKKTKTKAEVTKKPAQSTRSAVSTPKTKEVSVFEGKNLVRTYSKDLHGDNFEALAKSFVSDRPNYSIK